MSIFKLSALRANINWAWCFNISTRRVNKHFLTALLFKPLLVYRVYHSMCRVKFMLCELSNRSMCSLSYRAYNMSFGSGQKRSVSLDRQHTIMYHLNGSSITRNVYISFLLLSKLIFYGCSRSLNGPLPDVTVEEACGSSIQATSN